MSGRVSARPTPPSRPLAASVAGSAYYVDRDRLSRRGPWEDHQPLSDIGRSTAREVPTPRRRSATTPDNWTPSVVKTPVNYSTASLENARYHVGGPSRADHSNEDRDFALEGDGFQVFAVFDGHDGPRAAGFASNYFMEYFQSSSWQRVVPRDSRNIQIALQEFFRSTEAEFFKSIQAVIDEKNTLQAVIPPVSSVWIRLTGTVVSKLPFLCLHSFTSCCEVDPLCVCPY